MSEAASPVLSGSSEWRNEILAFGCYRCGHESSLVDPCDEECEGVPLSWTQMQDNTESPVSKGQTP